MQVNKFVPIVGFCAISLLSSSALADQHELWVVHSVTQKCLDATTADDYGRVQVSKCDTNLIAQQWIVDQPVKGNIQNAYDGFGNPCLDMTGKFKVMTKKCNPKLRAQTWYLPPKGMESLIGNGYFKGRCLKVAEDDTVISVSCNSKDRSQIWKFVTPEKSTPCKKAQRVASASPTLPVKPICSFAPPPGPCTRDKNECGYASQCECPVLYVYNPATGHCDLSFNTDTKPAAKAVEDKKPTCSFAPPSGSICTFDRNICGNPSICTCPLRYHYNPATKTCDLSDPR